MSNSIKVRPGYDLKMKITIRDDVGNPVDLTGAVVTFRIIVNGQIRFASPSNAVGSQTTLDPTEGVINLWVTDEETEQLPATLGRCAYDVAVALPGDVTFPAIEGTAHVGLGILHA